MLVLIKRVTIKVDFSAADWQLYTASMDCTEPAKYLNAMLMAVVNRGATRREAEKKMHETMNSYSKFGATDSEPVYFLEQVLDEIYGERSGW